MEYQRGMKAITIPAHNFPTCRDILVKCIKFVLPEDLSVSGGQHDFHVRYEEPESPLYRTQYRYRLQML